MSRVLKLKLMVVFGIVLALLLGGGLWYVSVYTKTPEYAVQKVQASFERHDTELFHKYVNVDSMLGLSYDEMVLGLIEVEQPMKAEEMEAIGDFSKMLKAPMITSLKMAIDQYVATGTWEAGNSADKGTNGTDSLLDLHQILVETGIMGMEFRSVESIVTDESTGSAVASVHVYQKDMDKDFVFEIMLSRKDDGDWCIEEVRNFKDFIILAGKARHAEIDRYMEESAKIMEQHDKLMQSAGFEYQKILAEGSLGKQETRDALRRLMDDTIAKDWKERKSELELLETPNEALSLHHLRLRICDCHIAYAEGYAKWMTDKKAATIREADSNLKQAKTLEEEARFLMKRLGAGASS